jgi:hypothetical protein
MNKELLEKQNQDFHYLPKKEQRILISHDVLLQLKSKTIVANSGSHLYFILSNKPYLYNNNLQELLSTETDACQVCALGAAFLSMTRLGNTPHPYANVHSVLIPIFGDEQVHLICYAFEGSKDYERIDQANHLSEGGYLSANSFFNRYPIPNKRLEAIFSNIISNDGEFIL